MVIPHAASGLERHAALNALRLASVKAAVYVARSAFDQPAAETEVMDIGGPADSGREGLPRFAYIGQIHSRQRVAEVDEQILYGSNTTGMMPVILHPNEWLDGAVIISHLGGGVETYFYQNHPVVTELIRWHKAGKITFVGTIASVGASDDEDRTLNCVLASEQAKWNLAADGVVLTKYGGGAPHSDMGLTARLCEELGMRTVVQAQAMSRDRQAESALLFNYPEVDAIVATGGVDIHWEVPAVENVIAPNPDVATALSQPQDLAAARVAGVSSQQGASYVRAFSY